MRTSILYGRNYNHRAFLPGEIPGDEKQAKAFPKAVFEAAHSFESIGLNLSTSGKLMSTPKQKHHRPDSIVIGDRGFRLGLYRNRIAACLPHRDNGDVYGAVVVGPEYVARLDELDNQIERLQAERRDVMAEAAKHGKPLARQDLEVR